MTYEIPEESFRELLLAIRSHLAILKDSGWDKDKLGKTYLDVQRLRDAYRDVRDIYDGLLKDY
jgi:hypothetical protein